MKVLDLDLYLVYEEKEALDWAITIGCRLLYITSGVIILTVVSAKMVLSKLNSTYIQNR